MAPRSAKPSVDSGPSPERAPDSTQALKTKLAALPALPGVYWFKGRRGEVLYVGKAVRLDQRVRGHFQDPASVGVKQVAMIRKVADVDFLAVDSEVDALLLEATLVREHRPPYNIQLKDDKRYPYIRVSWQEPYPRMSLVRALKNDGARYFGPYAEVKALRQLLRTTLTLFPMRSCRDIDAHIAARRECLDYHIGRCMGPCIAAQSREEYRAVVAGFCDFLLGKRESVVARLKGLQGQAAARRDYERAGRYRDQIRGIESMLERQRVVDVAGASTDILGTARIGSSACAVILKVRERRVVARDVRWLKGAAGADDADLLRSLIALYYADPEQVPQTILAEVEPGEQALLELLLSKTTAASVKLRRPRDETERALTKTARRNAALLLEREGGGPSRRATAEAYDATLDAQRALGLDRPPKRIRCFDVSTLFGRHSVASMVTFVDGRPLVSQYRRYRIATVGGQDDFASIAEAVRRHAARVDAGDLEAADLILIDGGSGQLEAARGAARGTALEAAPIAALAKRLEELYLPGRGSPLTLARRSPALKLLMRIRDEAHRFAIRYHRSLRGREARRSKLEEIPGLGPKRRALLLQRFGSVERLKHAPEESIAAVPGIGRRMAARIAREVGGESRTPGGEATG